MLIFKDLIDVKFYVFEISKTFLFFGMVSAHLLLQRVFFANLQSSFNNSLDMTWSHESSPHTLHHQLNDTGISFLRLSHSRSAICVPATVEIDVASTFGNLLGPLFLLIPPLPESKSVA